MLKEATIPAAAAVGVCALTAGAAAIVSSIAIANAARDISKEATKIGIIVASATSFGALLGAGTKIALIFAAADIVKTVAREGGFDLPGFASMGSHPTDTPETIE